jgi:hypothetical protein
VLQAGYGPGLRLDREDARGEATRERGAILNGYFLSGGSAADLCDEISPVSTFGLTFNQYSGTEDELLAGEGFSHPGAVLINSSLPVTKSNDASPAVNAYKIPNRTTG